MTEKPTWGFATNAIRAAEHRDPATEAHSTPIYQTASFSFEKSEDLSNAFVDPDGPNFYTREGNPTVDVLQNKMAILQGTEACLTLSSGMATVSVAVRLSSKAGDHLIVSDKLFVVSQIFFEIECPNMGLEVTAVDMLNLAAVEEAIKPNTKVLYT